MKKLSLSPDEASFNPLPKQEAKDAKRKANLKKNEILKQKGLHKDFSSSSLKIFGDAYFFNYELSWLKFNARVLAEAQNNKNKILERVHFLAIVCSNLDEFFSKASGRAEAPADGWGKRAFSRWKVPIRTA
jgi:polyphosphate kinase